MRFIPIILVVMLFTACGGSEDDGFPDDIPTGAYPVVSRVAPAAGAPGDAITIFGMGFSDAYANNIVIIGGAAVSATGYALVANPTATEIESITATVPATAAVGATTVVVDVYENASNDDIVFTVN